MLPRDPGGNPDRPRLCAGQRTAHRQSHGSGLVGGKRACRCPAIPVRATCWRCVGRGLQVKTIWVARAVSVLFPQITNIFGYRQDPLKWHPNGLAIDVMIPNHHSDEGIQLGNQVAGLALANAKRWGVLHVIWRQGYYPGIGAPSWTADYGSETLNHYDHVHIATDGGGYPTGRETYYVGSMSPTPPE